MAILRRLDRPLQQQIYRQRPIQMVGENVDAFGHAYGISDFKCRRTLSGDSNFPFRLIFGGVSDQSLKRLPLYWR